MRPKNADVIPRLAALASELPKPMLVQACADEEALEDLEYFFSYQSSVFRFGTELLRVAALASSALYLLERSRKPAVVEHDPLLEDFLRTLLFKTSYRKGLGSSLVQRAGGIDKGVFASITNSIALTSFGKSFGEKDYERVSDRFRAQLSSPIESQLANALAVVQVCFILN